MQFWTYVLASLDTLHPGLSAEPLSLLQSEQSTSIETVLVTLMNALDALRQHSVLILDDYHSIEAIPNTARHDFPARALAAAVSRGACQPG